MINKWPIRCSTSLVTREIKTTERYHFPYTRTATVKKVNTSVDEDVKKSEPFYISSECKMVQLLIYTLCPLLLGYYLASSFSPGGRSLTYSAIIGHTHCRYFPPVCLLPFIFVYSGLFLTELTESPAVSDVVCKDLGVLTH